MVKAKLSMNIDTKKAQQALDLIIQFGGCLSDTIECDDETESVIQYHLTEIAKICAVSGIKFGSVVVDRIS